MDKRTWEPEWAGVTITEWARDIASVSQREQESGLNTVLFVAKMLFVVNKPEKNIVSPADPAVYPALAQIKTSQ